MQQMSSMSPGLQPLQALANQQPTDEGPKVKDSMFGLVEKHLSEIPKEFSAAECTTLERHLKGRVEQIQKEHFDDGPLARFLDKLGNALQGHGWKTSHRYAEGVEKTFREEAKSKAEAELKELTGKLDMATPSKKAIALLAEYRTRYEDCRTTFGLVHWECSDPKTQFEEQARKLAALPSKKDVDDIIDASWEHFRDINPKRPWEIQQLKATSGGLNQETTTFVDAFKWNCERLEPSGLTFKEPTDYSVQLGKLDEELFKNKLPALAERFAQKGWDAPEGHKYAKIWQAEIDKVKQGPKFEANLDGMKAGINAGKELTTTQKGQVVAFMNDLTKEDLQKWATTPENKQAFKDMIALYREEQASGNKAANSMLTGLFDLWAREWDPKWYE